MNINYKHLRVGLMGVGLEAYWEQFEGLEQWSSHGPAHHCAIGLGHIAGQLRKVTSLLDFGFIQVD